MSLSSRLNKTVAVKRKSRASDGRGGSTITYTTAIASLSCRISAKSSAQRFLGDKVDSDASHVIFVLSSAAVKLHDQVIDGSDTYEVLSINKPSRGNHFELDAQLIRDEN